MNPKLKYSNSTHFEGSGALGTTSYNMYSQQQQPMAAMGHHQSISCADAYNGKSAETRHLKPGELSTGTTIMAVQFDGGVVLCAGEF